MMTITRNDMSRRAVLFVLAVIATVVLSAVVSQMLLDDASADHEDSTGSATVRVSALPRENGDLTLALQQQTSDGAWAVRVLPQHRVLPADVSGGGWLNSSPVTVDTGTGGQPLFCIVAHGDREDYFWRVVRGFSRQAALDNGLAVRFTQSQSGADQAAEVQRCSADGASVIAATLPAPDAVTPSLIAAKEAGVRIITFNSGFEDAINAGSELHIALDDAEAGRLAGREFNRHGVTGAVGCLLHEADNVGLESRCEQLEASYEGGDVLRIYLPEGAANDEINADIAARLTDAEKPALHALLALHGDAGFIGSLQAILETADELEHTVKIGSIGVNHALPDLPLDEIDQHVLFHIGAGAEAQGYLITAALHMVHGYTTSAAFIQRPLIMNAIPSVYDAEAIRTESERRSEMLVGLGARLALGDDYVE